jgi:hypothetical protein
MVLKADLTSHQCGASPSPWQLNGLESPRVATGKIVFGGPLSPVGWSVGFLRAPFAKVRLATLEWYRSLAERYGFVMSTVDLALGIFDALARLDPLQTPPQRELIAGSDGEWTAHFANSHLGGDSVSWVGHLSRVLECDGVLASHIPVGEYQYPSTQLTLEGPSRTSRTLAAGKYDSGRWEFLQAGAPLSFEQVERYSSKRIRDRFSREMLLAYLSALGIEPDRESFYRSMTLVQREPLIPPRVSSIADTRREYGIT